jgi:hypothetical protein
LGSTRRTEAISSRRISVMSSRQRTSTVSSDTTILRGIDSDIRATSATMNEVNHAER